jgi:Zn-dependent protease with chaperone function
MDMLSDQVLLFVIAHEMGDVVKKHIKEKMLLALAGSALQKTIASK